MQTLTKTEIAWIHAELITAAKRANAAKNEASAAGYHDCARIAETRRDGLQNLAHKLHTALNDNDKRIAIK